jgi:2,3-bisphosphoglycerate-independent phosphoglycerate mutase
MGIGLGAEDVAYRCNLVSIGEQDSDQAFMDDFTAGHISSAEAGEMILEINAKIGSSQLQFYPGVGYRHLRGWRNAAGSPQTTPLTISPERPLPPICRGDYAAEVQ